MGESGGVTIGVAARLYGLAPSTLRWWESQGVLPEPKRQNGRRVYSETDLRRIGLAYLCCITGSMPLDQAAAVLSPTPGKPWQGVVSGHADRLAERIERLQDARRYLLHLSECPDGDIVTECPYLDDELAKHTPRGRHDTQIDGDELNHNGDVTSETAQHCAHCAAPLTQPRKGRRRRYCSHTCRQRRYVAARQMRGEAPTS